ncbi:hypothetical protein BAUCODRAFT_126141 [Baudoinia panamericana UAMH 10762]|uniref:FHA domain-containing protein n=1 Tax=Baudoinia panamericana (strain UAMH 10762) TaxID=717646 RepID=M2N0I8_BAUPA|nr:uncharacterized protein BAUCODRAFT_126141 [Baudoinia panamericana UAMH 10762]EMC92130.1 hypothetical protein BAUCODRAFT_126141 [Baudoinia panamericana UAMH 10762]
MDAFIHPTRRSTISTYSKMFPTLPCNSQPGAKTTQSRQITLSPVGAKGLARHITIYAGLHQTIGRASRSDSKYSGPSANNTLFECPVVSRQHAELRYNPFRPVDQQVTIIDKDSMHGTYVNDERLDAHSPCPLRSGDLIRFGDKVVRAHDIHEGVVVRFEISDNSAFASTSQSASQVKSKGRGYTVPSDDGSDVSSDDDLSIEDYMRIRPLTPPIKSQSHNKPGSQNEPIDLEAPGAPTAVIELDDDDDHEARTGAVDPLTTAARQPNHSADVIWPSASQSTTKAGAENVASQLKIVKDTYADDDDHAESVCKHNTGLRQILNHQSPATADGGDDHDDAPILKKGEGTADDGDANSIVLFDHGLTADGELSPSEASDDSHDISEDEDEEDDDRPEARPSHRRPSTELGSPAPSVFEDSAAVDAYHGFGSPFASKQVQRVAEEVIVPRIKVDDIDSEHWASKPQSGSHKPATKAQTWSLPHFSGPLPFSTAPSQPRYDPVRASLYTTSPPPQMHQPRAPASASTELPRNSRWDVPAQTVTNYSDPHYSPLGCVPLPSDVNQPLQTFGYGQPPQYSYSSDVSRPPYVNKAYLTEGLQDSWNRSELAPLQSSPSANCIPTFSARNPMAHADALSSSPAAHASIRMHSSNATEAPVNEISGDLDAEDRPTLSQGSSLLVKLATLKTTAGTKRKAAEISGNGIENVTESQWEDLYQTFTRGYTAAQAFASKQDPIDIARATVASRQEERAALRSAIMTWPVRRRKLLNGVAKVVGGVVGGAAVGSAATVAFLTSPYAQQLIEWLG